MVRAQDEPVALLLGTPLPEEQLPAPDVEKLLGRPARTFATWARRNAAAFA
ncbi:hypothetical protein [Streptomyces sp. NPDC005494]|uniref:hypothetical protein n=1 Tax=Streptomyces sp. NPDC005494 TaxID=3364715 RepID=UPI0036AE4D03